MTLTGKVLDMDFAKGLAENQGLSLEHIIMFDKVQKRRPIIDSEQKILKDLGLIEGRKPNFFISAKVVADTDDGILKAQYIKQRGFDDEHYKKMIIEYLQTYGSASR